MQSTMPKTTSILIVLASALPSFASALNCKGCTPLDILSFDKLINNFPFSIIKFDVAYPYGDKHEEFAKVAVDGAEVSELFVGEVGIKDYGDKDNEELGKRFDIKKDEYPVVMIFIRQKEGEPEAHRFAGEFNSESLKSFLRQHTGVYLPLQGCLEQFDRFADRLLEAKGDQRAQVVKEAEQAVKELKDEKKKKRAELYVKIMNKIVGDYEFVTKESERTKKLLEGKLTEAKKTELQEKINVLRSFTRQPEKTDKDEL